MTRRWLKRFGVLLGVLALGPLPHERAAWAAAGPRPLEEAIAALRHVAPEALAASSVKRRAIQNAWKVIRAQGQVGLERLKRELEQVDKANEQDPLFKLNAGALLWIMGGLSEADRIATIWNTTPIQTQYNYVFFPAFEAAKTRDPRALPMLTACLRDTKGWVITGPDSMKVTWPLTHEILWGTFGPKGLPVLLEFLNACKGTPESQSAMVLLAKAQCLEALPAIRSTTSLATVSDKAYRTAVECLGLFGHPRDYAFLLSGLKHTGWRAQRVRSHVFALAEYEDLRAVPHLAPLLRQTDDKLRRQVIISLAHLLTPESLVALHAHSRTADRIPERTACKKLVANLLNPAGLTWPRYAEKPAAERAGIAAALRALGEDAFRLKPKDRRLTRPQFLAVMADWRQRGSITGGVWDWVEDRHLLSAARADDIPRLLEVKAALYAQLSPRTLAEVGIIDDLVQRLGRSRYRGVVGVTEGVTPR